MLLLPSSKERGDYILQAAEKLLLKCFLQCFVFINNLFNHIKSGHCKLETVSLKLFSFHNFCGSKGAKELHGRSEWNPKDQ